MKEKYKIILEGLGYDVDCLGALLFSDLIDVVVDLRKSGKNKNEIIELLPRYYLEFYHFIYEIGMKTFYSELGDFLNSKVITKKTKVTNKRFKLLYKNYTLDDLLWYFGNYFYSVEVGKIEEIKVFKKVNCKVKNQNC